MIFRSLESSVTRAPTWLAGTEQSTRATAVSLAHRAKRGPFGVPAADGQGPSAELLPVLRLWQQM